MLTLNMRKCTIILNLFCKGVPLDPNLFTILFDKLT
jgi:hypothetical protein